MLLSMCKGTDISVMATSQSPSSSVLLVGQFSDVMSHVLGSTPWNCSLAVSGRIYSSLHKIIMAMNC